MVVAVVCVLPPLWLFVSSFKSIPEFYAQVPTLLPKHFDFKKFFETWRVLSFHQYYLRSIEMALGDMATMGLSIDQQLMGIVRHAFGRAAPRLPAEHPPHLALV